MEFDEVKSWLEAGDVPRARAWLIDFVDQGHETEGAWLLLAAIGMRANDAELSLRAFRAIEKTRPHDAYVASGLVDALMSIERYQEAREVILSFRKVAKRGAPFHDAVLEEHEDALSLIEERMRAEQPSLGDGRTGSGD
ncbi:hypothetical protein [Stenotrophomonas sepilia]|uniref:hypothetical protein n=1 Tax=Stenotrophomonas sepilia TaxID=2860290 RepID=UPI002E7A3ECA|nr:hypothetical protein [Stenotrophomonas sepilia]